MRWWKGELDVAVGSAGFPPPYAPGQRVTWRGTVPTPWLGVGGQVDRCAGSRSLVCSPIRVRELLLIGGGNGINGDRRTDQ